MKFSSSIPLVLCGAPMALGRLGSLDDTPCCGGRELQRTPDVNAMQALVPPGGQGKEEQVVFDLEVFLSGDTNCNPTDHVPKFVDIMSKSVKKTDEKIPEYIKAITGKDVVDFEVESELEQGEDNSGGWSSWYYSGSSRYSSRSNGDWFSFDPKVEVMPLATDGQAPGEEGQQRPAEAPGPEPALLQPTDDEDIFVLMSTAQIEAEQLTELQDMVNDKRQLIADMEEELKAVKNLCKTRMMDFQDEVLKVTEKHKVQQAKVEESGLVESEIVALLKPLAEKQAPETKALEQKLKKLSDECVAEEMKTKAILNREIANAEKSQRNFRKTQIQRLRGMDCELRKMFRKAREGEYADAGPAAPVKTSVPDTSDVASIKTAMAALATEDATGVMNLYHEHLLETMKQDLKDAFEDSRCMADPGLQIDIKLAS